MKPKTKSVPKSKAKTAYALLGEIATLIVAEPKRYNQYNWIATDAGPNKSTYCVDHGFPECGTVACVAGWVVALTAPRGNRTPYAEVPALAARTLGLHEWQANTLFNGAAADGETQTAEHARSGARHIRNFRKAHVQQLKAKTLA